MVQVRRREIKGTEFEIGRALRHAPELYDGTMLAFEEFASEIMMTKPMPRPEGVEIESERNFPRPFETVDRYHLTEYLQSAGYAINKSEPVKAAILSEAYRNSYNWAHDMLNTLPGWESGRPPGICNFARDICGAGQRRQGESEAETHERVLYLEEVSRVWWVGMIGRMMEPGCKFDTMPLLEGATDIGKSTLCRNVCLRPEWFSDSMPLAMDRESRMHMRGKQLIEMPEIEHLNLNSNDRKKAFLSSQWDMVRVPWAEKDKPLKRTAIFVGTTNKLGYLDDDTGNRRYLPIHCGSINLDLFKQQKVGFYSEAMMLWKSGSPMFINDSLLREAARNQQKRRQAPEDPWITAIREQLKLSFNNSYETEIEFETGPLYTAIFGADMRSRDRKAQQKLSDIMLDFFHARRGLGRYATYVVQRDDVL